jgi:sodium transport system permease protein
VRTQKIKTVYIKEIIETSRDKKTLFMMIVVPLILYPLVFIGTGYFSGVQREKNRELTAKVAVADYADGRRLADEIERDERFSVVPVDNEESALAEGDIQLAVRVPPGFERMLDEQDPAVITVLYDESSVQSVEAKKNFIAFFDEYKTGLIKEQLNIRGIDSSLIDIVSLDAKNVATAEKMGAFIVGRVMPILVLILAFTGAMHTATSVTAGEKVRQTMETLLVSAISRKEIVLGKYLAVLTTSVTSSFLGLVSLFITFQVGFTLLSAATGMQITISSLSTLIMFVMILPVAGIFSALLVALGSYARTTKEAEMYSSSCIIIILALGMVSMTPGFEPAVEYFLIPVMNTTLIQKELLMSDFDVLHIVLALGSSLALAAAALYLANRLFSREEILFRT